MKNEGMLIRLVTSGAKSALYRTGKKER